MSDLTDHEFRVLAAFGESFTAEQRDRVVAVLRGQPKNDPLHPTGRCECAGEGRCTWCLMDSWRERALKAEAGVIQAERAGMERAAKICEGYTHSTATHGANVIRLILRNTEPGGEWQPPFPESS